MDTIKSVTNVRDLIVWKKSHQFIVDIDQRTHVDSPDEENDRFMVQFCRAVLSIAANIAEGFRKQTKTNKAKMLSISGRLFEACRDYIFLTKDFEFMHDAILWELTEDIGHILNIHRLNAYHYTSLTSNF